MAVIRSGASLDELTIDPISKAARVVLFDAAGNALSGVGKQSFAASASFTPAATPTDLVTIFGSATKTVRVWSFKLATTNTAAGSQQYLLIKRSAVDTTGTFVAGVAVPLDSSNSAATATGVGHYTANPGGLGAVVGTIITSRVASPAAVPASFAGVAFDAGIDLLALWNSGNSVFQPVVLRGIVQGLCLNFNGAALVAGQTHTWNIVWTEE